MVIDGVTRLISDCKYHLYADDLSVYHESDIHDIENNIKIVNKNIKLCNSYITRMGLSFNPKKSNVIIIGAQKNIKSLKQNFSTIPKIYVNDTEIEYVNKLKYLGFIFNENFQLN